MRMKSGIGVSENVMTDAIELRANWSSPATPPMNTKAPTTLADRNARATGIPSIISATTIPSKSSRLCIQSIFILFVFKGENHAAEVASSLTVFGSFHCRRNRNRNSTPRRANITDAGASTHHSGKTKIFMMSEP